MQNEDETLSDKYPNLTGGKRESFVEFIIFKAAAEDIFREGYPIFYLSLYDNFWFI